MKRQFGLSMIELLIAMAISSFLILGVTQIFIDNKRNYLYQQSQSENQENGRFTLMLLDRQLAKTGYRRRPDDTLEQAFPANTLNSCTFTAGQTITRVNDHTLCLRYQPRDPAELDCSGTGLSSANAASVAEPYTTPAQPFVETVTISGGNLTCNGAVLVEGVSGVVFEFGTGPTGEREVTSYTKTPGNAPIRSLRYSALLESTQKNLAQGIASKACEQWEALSGTDPCKEDRIYQIASSSTTLRNLMP